MGLHQILGMMSIGKANNGSGKLQGGWNYTLVVGGLILGMS